MADLARIKENVARMAEMNAPESDIDGYIASEGVSLDQVRDYQSAAQPLSRLDNFQNSVAQRASKVGTGLYGMALDAMQGVGMLDPAVAQSAKEIVSEGRAAQEKNFPTQPGVERFVGDTLANPSTFTPGGIVKSAAMAGATDAALETDPAATAADKGINAVMGGGIGAATGKVLDKAFTPVKNSLTPEQKRLADIAKKEGIDLTAAQKTGSKVLGLMEAGFDNLPFTAGRQAAKREDQLTQFTKAALSKAGIASSEATPDVLRAGYDKVGGEINSITFGAKMPIDNQYMSDVLNVLGEYGDVIDPMRKPQFDAIVNSITKGSELAGGSYQKTRSQLGKMMKSAWGSDPNYANALEGLQDAMDNAVERALPADKSAALQTARRQYGNLKTVMKAASSTSKDSTAGFLTPTALQNAVKTANPTAYTTGKGDLNDLARVGGAFLKNSVPDSGTASRQAVQKALQLQMPVIPASVGFAAAGLPGAVAGGVASVAAPRAIQAVYNHPLAQFYMSKGMPIPPDVQAFISKAVAEQGNGLIEE